MNERPQINVPMDSGVPAAGFDQHGTDELVEPLAILRDRLLRGEFPKHTYLDRVVSLRNKYSVLALRPAEFVE